jgi:hypothetical protein
MNPSTLVTVHGYAGDEHQVRNALPLYEHHQCSVVIFSPVDSPIKKVGPHICQFAGKRAYTGPESLCRQCLQMEAMLKYPFEWFLANDSDSVCLSPQIPDYVYAEPEVLWSNKVSDMMHARPSSYSWPRYALQPPYFMSRRVIERLLSVAGRVKIDMQTPFIDWAMMAWAVASGCPYNDYRDGASYPTTNSPEGLAVMRRVVSTQGKIFVHSIKEKRVLNWLVSDRASFLKQSRRIRPGQKIVSVGSRRR